MNFSSEHRAAWPRLPGWCRRALALPEALAARLRRSELALPLATAAVLAVVVINETIHARSVEALARLENRSLANAQVEAVGGVDVDAQHAQYLVACQGIYLSRRYSGVVPR